MKDPLTIATPLQTEGKVYTKIGVTPTKQTLLTVKALLLKEKTESAFVCRRDMPELAFVNLH